MGYSTAMKTLREYLSLLSILFALGVISHAKIIITPEEAQVLKEFRPLVTDILTHDYQKTDQYLIRWLQAKDLDVDEGVKMLEKAQKWRKRNKMDVILNETFPEFSHLTYTDDGVDNEGRTVFTSSLGDYDVRRILITGQRERYLRFNLYAIEKAVTKAAQAQLDSNGTIQDSRIVAVTDFYGFSLRKHGCLGCLQLFSRLRRLRSDYFPGIVALSVSINTPRIAISLSSQYLAPIISPDAKSEFKVFGTNRTEWSEYLHTIIPSDQLTYQFGGTKRI